MELLNIVIITVLTALVLILLSIVICVCLKKKNKATPPETVNENHYYEGFQRSTVYYTDNSNVVDKNDYYKV